MIVMTRIIRTIGTRTFREDSNNEPVLVSVRKVSPHRASPHNSLPLPGKEALTWYLCLPCVRIMRLETRVSGETHKIYSHTNKNHLLPSEQHRFANNPRSNNVT